MFIPRLATALAGAALFLATPARASLTNLDIYNNVLYQQTSSAAPITSTGYFFSMGGAFQALGQFNTASVAYPGPATQQQTINGTSFAYGSPILPSLSSLHASFPFGTYTTTVKNSSTLAQQSGSIAYAADYFTSTRPAVTAATWTSLQSLNPATALTLNFNAYIPNANTNAAYTFVTIFDRQNNAVVYAQSFLPSTTTSAPLPANTLLPNHPYDLLLNFTNRIGTTVNNILLTQGFDARTDILFTTTAIPEPATLAPLALAATLCLTRRRR